MSHLPIPDLAQQVGRGDPGVLLHRPRDEDKARGSPGWGLLLSQLDPSGPAGCRGLEENEASVQCR